MSDSSYKLQVRIGAHEFSAEGPEQAVERAYRAFLDRVDQAPAITKPPAVNPPQDHVHHGDKVSQEMIQRMFKKDRDVVSLRILPPGQGAPRDGMAAISLLYGFKILVNQPDVPVTKLLKGLRASGLNPGRMDSILGAHRGRFLRGGTRVGQRFTLTNQGENDAQQWISEWLKQ